MSLEQLCEDNGYTDLCYVKGKAVAISKFIFTYGILVGLTEYDYECRYCYPNYDAAYRALCAWRNSSNEEPEGYIKKK